ncbi:MAG: FkbM family methyltransferase [Xanthobacteraceae bacterium]
MGRRDGLVRSRADIASGLLDSRHREADRELQVKCIPFTDVIQSLPDPRRLDLLQIDAEGADGYILSLFPFDRLQPAIVHWEIKNMTRLQQEAALDLLCSRGYLISRSGGEDMLAVRGDNG